MPIVKYAYPPSAPGGQQPPLPEKWAQGLGAGVTMANSTEQRLSHLSLPMHNAFLSLVKTSHMCPDPGTAAPQHELRKCVDTDLSAFLKGFHVTQ